MRVTNIITTVRIIKYVNILMNKKSLNVSLAVVGGINLDFMILGADSIM